jgi:large subunit ribosomal protein L30
VRGNIEDTLRLMCLNHINHSTIIHLSKSKNMVMKAKDYVTWGEVDDKLITELIAKRGHIAGNKPVSDDYVKKNSKHASIAAFAKAFAAGEAGFKDVKGLKPVFRLNPPRKGFERGGIKKSVKDGGALGYRGAEISRLIKRMM